MRTALRTVLLAPPSARTAFDPDPDTRAYITAVESADGQALEPGVRTALDAFVRGCKADGIWDAIKASCIMAGARTLAGALVPLKGTAPTNFNFVSGDYNRKTGLIGDGSTKYLDSGRNTNADPQNSYSVCAWVSSPGTPSSATQLYLGGMGTLGRTSLGIASSQLFSRNRSSVFTFFGVSSSVGFLGASRSAASDYLVRSAGASQTLTVASSAPANSATHIFAESASGSTCANARLAYYSIGNHLDLALLDARVTTLVNTFASTIP